jgi:hypothetical protein
MHIGNKKRDCVLGRISLLMHTGAIFCHLRSITTVIHASGPDQNLFSLRLREQIYKYIFIETR